MIEKKLLSSTCNPDGLQEQLGLNFEPIENLLADIELENLQVDNLWSQENIRNTEEQRILEEFLEPIWKSEDPSTPIINHKSFKDNLRDKILIDIFDFPEGDSPKEVLKTGVWELKETARVQVPALTRAFINIASGIYKDSKTIFNNMQPVMRRITVATVASGVLAVGLLAQQTPEVDYINNSSTGLIIEMPKNISIAYSVPKSNPRVLDLAHALGIEPKIIIDQLDNDGRKYAPTSALAGGTILNLQVQGTKYKPAQPQTFEYIVQKFNVTGGVLLAANPELAGIGNDGLISSVVTIPKPVTIVQTPTTLSNEAVAKIPEIKDAIDEGQNIADSDKGVAGNIYVIADSTLDEMPSTSITETTITSDSTTTITPELGSIEVITPEVARVNTALDTIKIDSNRIDLSELTEAVKVMYATYRPNDTNRLPNTPNGYVKMMLAHEAIGLNVPFTVAERTADVERYSSPQTYAVFLAYAKVFQLRLVEYPELAGTMARLRDGNAPAHMDHNNGTSLDIGSAKGFGVKQYSDGPIGDFQFSSNFNKALTEEVISDMAKFVINGKPAIRRILTSGQTMAPNVNNRVGRAIMQISNYHKDHLHLVMNTDFTLTQWRPRISDLPWSETQDLKIGLSNNGISREQHNSQHQDFEQYITDKERSISEQKVTINTPTTTEVSNPIDKLPAQTQEALLLQLPKIKAIKKIYLEIEKQTGVPWQIMAAIHYREGMNNPNQSMMAGEKIGSVNPDKKKVIGHNLLQNGIIAANTLKSLAHYYYGVEIRSEMTRSEIEQVLVAFNRGGRYVKAGVLPSRSPYVSNGLPGHLDMEFPYSGEPPITRGRTDARPGAIAMLIALGYIN